MKPETYKAAGRKIHEVHWNAVEQRVPPEAVTGGIAKATIEIRFMEDEMAFNGRVDGTIVYAESDSVQDVVAQCEAQLNSLHCVEWVEKMWVRFAGLGIGSHRDHGLSVSRVRLSNNPSFPLWQIMSSRLTPLPKKISRRHATPDERKAALEARSRVFEWTSAKPGVPKTGVWESEDGEQQAGFLCDPDPLIEQAVESLRSGISSFFDGLSQSLLDLFHAEENLRSKMRAKRPADKVVYHDDLRHIRVF